MSTLPIDRFAFLNTTKGQLLIWLLRLVIAGVFLFAAIPKLRDPVAFADSIRNYQMVSDSWASMLALFLPMLELIVAVCLIIPFTRRGAAIVSAGMLLMFCFVIGQAMYRGIDIDCGCFGAAQKARADWPGLVRNILLFVCALLVFIDPYRNDVDANESLLQDV